MLEVSNLTWVDEDPALSPQPPLSCRLHLWHSWVKVRVDEGKASYVLCERCRRLASPTIFEQPVP